MGSPNFYAIIPANVRYDKNLTANAKLLYGEITALSSKEGHCWATNNYFADLYGVSVKSIKNWIKALIDKGYINCQLIYKKNSKEVEKRIIRIVTEIPQVGKKITPPQEEKFTTPREEKFTDSITKTFSNTKINTNTKDLPPTPEKIEHEISLPEKRFNEFWQAYPKKVGKGLAEKLYKKIKPDKELQQTILQAVSAAKQSKQWNENNGQYIPNPATWLNQKRWEDELEPMHFNQRMQQPKLPRAMQELKEIMEGAG